MATTKKESPLRSPLLSAFNNIVSINRSKSQMRSTQTSYNEFLRFMTVEVKNLEEIKLPDKKQLTKLSNLNITSTFGSAGSLLSSLASGALDVGGLVSNFFGGKGKNPKAGKAIPKGTRIKIPGIRGLPIISTALAGLDFAQGISQGESVGKAGAGALGSAAGAAGGALAGAALAGAIGQVLVPIPGLGFVLGAGVGALGGMAGGYLADRAYESATGEGKVKEKTKEKLKQQEQKQKLTAAASLTAVTFPQVLDKFDTVVTQFQRSVQNLAPEISSGVYEDLGETLKDNENINYRPDNTEEFKPTGDGKEVFPLVGGRPNLTSESDGGGFNSPRKGRPRHGGQDIGVDGNTPVVAAKSGKVANIASGYGGVGSAIWIRYDDGQEGTYGHVNPSGVRVGDKVQAGQKIATVTPNVTKSGDNTHLHYMRKSTGGQYIDPKPILQGSKAGPPLAKVDTKKDKLTGKELDSGDNQAMATPQNKMMPKPAQTSSKPTQDLSQMSTDQLKGMLDPTKTGASSPAAFKAAQEARTKGQESGISGETLERAVMMATIRAKNAESQVVSMSQQPVVPQQLQQYPDYNLPQSSVTIIPMMMGGSGGGSQQRPMVVSSGGGGGGTTIMPAVPEGHLLNSLFKTMLLTNLSGT
jgi:murein DD-endopeptidase MepM/ murein hydrolase activator NlpD